MIEGKSVLAIIPARGGSKGLLGKNIRPMCGKPLIGWSIDKAKKSKYIDTILVTTDSQEISDIAQKFGACVPFIRPAVLSEEFIDIFEVVKFTLERVEEDSKHFDLVVLLEEVYPFREENLIDNMILQLIYKGQDTVIAAIQEKRSVWVQPDNESELLNIEKDILMPRSLKKSLN